MLDKVTDFLLFLGKLLIVGIVGKDAAILLRPAIARSRAEGRPFVSRALVSLGARRDLLLLLLLRKDQSRGGGRAVSQLLLGPHTGEAALHWISSVIIIV